MTNPDAGRAAREQRHSDTMREISENMKTAEELLRLKDDNIALRQQAQELQANEGLMLRALSDALTGGNAGTWDEIVHAAGHVHNVVNIAEARVSAMEAALRTFGQHPSSCKKWWHHQIEGSILQPDRECTCGLNAALDGQS